MITKNKLLLRFLDRFLKLRIMSNGTISMMHSKNSRLILERNPSLAHGIHPCCKDRSETYLQLQLDSRLSSIRDLQVYKLLPQMNLQIQLQYQQFKVQSLQIQNIIQLQALVLMPIVQVTLVTLAARMEDAKKHHLVNIHFLIPMQL